MIQKIIIKSTAVETRSGTSKKNGNAYEMREQTAYLDTGHDFPDRFKLMLERDQQPHPAGEYYAENALVVGEYSSLDVARRIVLKPYPVRPAAPAAK